MPDAAPDAARPSASPQAPAPVLVVGEALIDAVRRPGSAEVAHPGGSPMNVAIGLSRLGVPALLHTSLAEDDDGRRVRDHLAADDVALTAGSVDPAGTTSRAVATIGPDGAASYDFAITWAPLPLPDGVEASVAAAGAVHVGSISAYLEPGAAQVGEVVAAAAARGIPVSFDPNVRPALLAGRDDAWARVSTIAASCTLLKLSDEDAAYLLPGAAPEEVVTRLRALGPAIVVLTCGGEGLLGGIGEELVRVPSAVIEVADTIGAGDTVSAALLAWVLTRGLPTDGDGLRAALRAAAAAAGITVSRPGADPPRLSELGDDWA